MIAANARKASLASAAVGKAAATSGSRTTTELPAAYRDAYLFGCALRKSYSGRISSAATRCLRTSLVRVFFIASPLTSRCSPGTQDTNCFVAVDEMNDTPCFAKLDTAPRIPFELHRHRIL